MKHAARHEGGPARPRGVRSATAAVAFVTAMPVLPVAAALLGALLPLASCARAVAPPADQTAALCGLCEKAIPDGKGVRATVGGEERAYRCIHCALTALGDEPADVEIRALTPLDAVKVSLRRHAGAWTSSPATTVFLILPERADECLDVHQPFTDTGEFERYLAEHPEIAAESPMAYTIGQYEQIVTAGKPQ